MLCRQCGAEASILADECPRCHTDLRQIAPFRPYVQSPATDAPPREARGAAASSGGSGGPVPTGFNVAEDLKKLVARVSDAVVTVRTRVESDGQKGESTGSGFVVAGSGLVVTNQHVIEDARTIKVIARDGRAVPARARAVSEDPDLAVLEPRLPLPRGVALGDSDGVGPGEFIVVIGNPLGEFEGSVTTGVISGIRQVSDGRRFLQLDAAISPGSSGGPVFNVKGEVIGVIVASVAADRAQNINLAIPASEVRDLLATVSRQSVAGATPAGSPIWADDGKKQWIPCWNCKGSGVEPGTDGETCGACGGDGGIYVDA